MLRMVKTQMRRASGPVGRPVHYGDARLPPSAPRGAKKKPARQPCGGLTATVPKSKFKSSHCKQAPYQNPNRNKLRVSVVVAALESLPTKHHSRITTHSISNRQLETIRNGRNPFEIKQMTFSNRPKKQRHPGRKTAGSEGGEQKANRNTPELEFGATGGKQRDMQILIETKNTILAARLSMRSLRDKAEKGDRIHG
jgi:hypothetical protein